MATQITSLVELNRFYMRTSICVKSEWAITCGPESVSTLKWKFSSDRIIVKENFKAGHAQVVTECGNNCEGCNLEVADLSELIRGLNFIPLNKPLA